MNKFLIIRFSSLGDIAQALPAAAAIKTQFPKSEVHWVTRQDFQGFAKACPHIDHLWTLNKKAGFLGLLHLFKVMSQENYTHIYDAHNNLRSNFLLLLWKLFFPWRRPKVVQRSKNRWRRFVFFKFRWKVLPQPFIGALSFLEPLQKWGISPALPPSPHLRFSSLEKKYGFTQKPYIVFAPSAAWPTKRWPVEHWKELVRKLNGWNIVLIGGPEDSFCQEIQDIAPENTFNMAGKTSLIESCEIVSKAELLISADTGFLHIADQMGIKNIGLMGPTAFGYTSQKQSQILEVNGLDCKPCSKDGRDPCTHSTYQKCMVDISPEQVAKATLVQLGML